MNIETMIYKYSIKIVDGDKIAVSVPKTGKRDMQQLEWIKAHKAEIISYIKDKEAEKKAHAEARDRAFQELRKSNPEMRRGNTLTERAIDAVISGADIDSAIKAYRCLYVDEMDAKANR